DGELGQYDWLHLHHEDFTGQFGKFLQYQNASWYIQRQKKAEEKAEQFGFRKVSRLKSAVARKIKGYVQQGGFLFSMCSGADTFDIALAAQGVDIVPAEYDGDPVPTMLTQNHVATVKGFVGQTTYFNPEVIKERVTTLAKAPERGHVKYLHGQFGKGTFTFYAGHDPEDYQHFVGDPQTDLSLHKRSPGYRLILNNILFPAAEKKKKKT
ncbi:MAG: asparagine synthetase B, partial [Bacteroidetes bacterium QH_2_67_10]